ncbi:MAG TPA: hypothetical protein VFC13_10065 [Actinomycetes bacterium]|nr:hypothetical protein [Actinomycetes bacterium]
MPEEPVTTARTGWRPWRAILVATVLAGLAVLLFATTAFSSSGRSPDSSGGSPAVEQVQQSPGDDGRDCPDKSGRGRSTNPSDASLDV